VEASTIPIWQKAVKRTVRGIIFFEIYEDEVSRTYDIEIPERISSANIIDTFQRTNWHPLKFSFAEDKSRIMSDISDVQSCFKDPQDRQISVSKLKSSINKLMDKLDPEVRVLHRVLTMTMDALKNTPSEHLKRGQIDTIKFVLDMIDKRLDDNEVNSLQQILIRSGLNPLPELESIAELYE